MTINAMNLSSDIEKPTIDHIDATGVDGKDTATENDDVALRFLRQAPAVSSSPEVEGTVLRKIDLYMMPLLIITFMLQYIDKVILTGAAQFGIIQDLKLYSVAGTDPRTHEEILNLHRFSIATLIFYWGCLAGLLPASWLAQKLPIGRYLAGTVILWGAVTMLTAVVTSYEGLLAQRFFLGVTECAVAPGFSIIISMWWKRNEQPLRYALWYTSTGLGGLVGALLIYGIGHIHGSLAPWKYQYLILGGLSCAWGCALFLLLPDNAVTARFLSQDEKAVAILRMQSEQIGVENKMFKPHQIKEACLDPKTWILFPTTFCLHFVNGGVSGFGSVIINSFGYSPLQSILLTGATGGVVLVSCIIVGCIGTFVRNSRTWLIVATEMLVIVGATLVWKLDWASQRAGAIVGFVCCGCFAPAYMMLLALVGANTAGHTKKAFTSGLIWCAWGISNGVAPLTVKSAEVSLHYSTCFIAVIGTAAITIAGALVLRAYLQSENNRRGLMVQGSGPIEFSFRDETDRENKQFRYVL